MRRSSLRRVSPGWVLTGLILFSALVRYVAERRLNGLWIMPDEVIYASLGTNLYEHGRFAVLNGPQVLYSIVYPALIGLPLSLAGIENGRAIVKAIQPLAMSLTAVPVYLWGRSLMPARWALVAAGLTLAVPGLLYTGLLMTHVVYYPVATLALWLIARALERETRRDQLLACAAILLALATRLQAVVFLPALVTAVLVKAGLERRPRLVARFAPTGLVLGSLAAVWIGYRLVQGGHWSSGLGAYAAAGTQTYDAGDVARFVSYHLGAVVLITGVVPACAVLLLALHAARGREQSAAVRAYVAIALSFVVWEVAEVGAFASENAGLVLERDISTIVPLAFLGFAVWLARGAPRPWFASSAIAIVAVAPLVTMPFDRLVGPGSLPDSFSFAPLLEFQREFPSVELVLVVSIAAAVLAALFLLAPRRRLAILPIVVLVWLVGASVASTREVTRRVRGEQAELLGGSNRDWIDDAVHSSAVYLYDGEPYWTGVWQEVFWNEKLRRVYDLGDAKVPGPLPQTAVAVLPDGRLVDRRGKPIRARYVVATAEHTFFGGVVTSLPQTGVETRGWTLWRLDEPVRLSTVMRGVKETGDIVGPARIVVYDCRGGRLRLTLLPKASDTVDVLLDGKLVKTLRFHGEKSWSGTFEAPKSKEPRICTYDLGPSSLLGSTVFQFER